MSNYELEFAPNWLSYLREWDVYEAFEKLHAYPRERLEIVETLVDAKLEKEMIHVTAFGEVKEDVISDVKAICLVPAYTNNILTDDVSKLVDEVRCIVGKMKEGYNFVCKLPNYPQDEDRMYLEIARLTEHFRDKWNIYTPLVSNPANPSRYFVGVGFIPCVEGLALSRIAKTIKQLQADKEKLEKEEKTKEFLSDEPHHLAKIHIIRGTALWKDILETSNNI